MGRGFLVDFFFGTCLDSAVDERGHPSNYSHDPYDSHNSHRMNGQNGHYGHKPSYDSDSRGRRHSRRSHETHRRSHSHNSHTSRHSHHSHNTHNSREEYNFSNIGKLDRDARRSTRSHRRDDVSVMGASLSETYLISREDGDDENDDYERGEHEEGDEDENDVGSLAEMEEQMVRRAVKNSMKERGKRSRSNGLNGLSRGNGLETVQEEGVNNHNGNHRDGRRSSLNRSQTGRGSLRSAGSQKSQRRSRSAASEASELTSYIEEHNEDKGDDETDYDNVTTISKASINPYQLLGISTSASAREIHVSYKRKLKETRNKYGKFHQGSRQSRQSEGVHSEDKAFRDVENAYRRLKAELRRKENRMEQRRLSQGKGRQSNQSKQKQTQQTPQSHGPTKGPKDDDDSDSSQRRESIDNRLKDHRALVHDLFSRDAKEQAQQQTTKGSRSKNRSSTPSVASSVTSSGHVTPLAFAIDCQGRALSEMNLVPVEAGATTLNEERRTITNSCFYLSLAASYLGGSGGFGGCDPTAGYFLNASNYNKNNTNGGSIVSGQSALSTQTIDIPILPLPPPQLLQTQSLALQLKRAIEAAVLLVHPEWSSTGVVGEEVQAFSDFLVYALDSDSVLGHWAIAVFDEASGFVDVYRGRHYGMVYPPKRVKSAKSKGQGGKGGRSRWKYRECDEATKRACTLTLRYIPGHYQPLLPELTRMKSDRRRGRKRSLEKRPTLEDMLRILDKWKVLHVVTDGRG